MGYRRISTTVTLAACLSLLVTSCGESKLVQCERLNLVTNRMAKRVLQFSQTPNTAKNYTTDLATLTADLETTAIEVRDLKFSDGRIRSFQSQFAQMYSDASQASRNLLAAAEQRDATAGTLALQSLKQVTNREAQLVTQANQYCCPNVDSNNRCISR